MIQFSVKYQKVSKWAFLPRFASKLGKLLHAKKSEKSYDPILRKMVTIVLL